jgi:cell division protein YceG involved in septum cleavage
MIRFIAILIAVAVIVAGAFEWERANFGAPEPAARNGKQTVVLIEPGSGVSRISDQLEQAGIITHA